MLRIQEATEVPSASRIYPRLWQGNMHCLQRSIVAQFQVVVLCAAEVQPSLSDFPSGVKIIRCPLHDVEKPLHPTDASRVMHTAQRCARSVLRDRRTLITCNAGLNRSGLVMATTLHLLTGQPGFECARIVRERRNGALFNRAFLRELHRLF